MVADVIVGGVGGVGDQVNEGLDVWFESGAVDGGQNPGGQGADVLWIGRFESLVGNKVMKDGMSIRLSVGLCGGR